jgi:hypothetical protein
MCYKIKGITRREKERVIAIEADSETRHSRLRVREDSFLAISRLFLTNRRHRNHLPVGADSCLGRCFSVDRLSRSFSLRSGRKPHNRHESYRPPPAMNGRPPRTLRRQTRIRCQEP